MNNDNNKPRHGSIVAQHPFHSITPVQLRFSDMDMLGHLNNTRYFDLLDLAKSEYFDRVAGGAIEWSTPPVMIANVNCDFLAQTRMHDHVEVRTQVDHIGDKSFQLIQQLVDSDTGEVKCSCASTMVYFDTTTGTPTRVSDEWRQAIAAFEHRDM